MSLTQEQLCHVLELRFRPLHFAIPAYRRVLDFLAGRRQDFADELIVRRVLLQMVDDPGMKSGGGPGVVFRIISLVPQYRRPFVGHLISVILARQQRVDQLLAPARGLISQEALRFLKRWQPSGDVDGGPANEGRVVTHRRRRQAKCLELLEDEIVDEVFRGRQLGNLQPQRNGGAEDIHGRWIASHDGHVAGKLPRGYQPRADTVAMSLSLASNWASRVTSLVDPSE